MDQFKLCFVRSPWAWFTTQDLDKQWGDDWNDAPYEHNAGPPYGPLASRGEEWYLLKVAFDGPLDEACVGVSNSLWSVQDINRGVAPWLHRSKFCPDVPMVTIPAGVSPYHFRRAVESVGGRVYYPAGVVAPE